MKKSFLGLAVSSILLSTLFIPTGNENVHATALTNKEVITQNTFDKVSKKDSIKKESEVVETKITSAKELRTYLASNYPELQTDIVTIKFNYSVIENDNISAPYDFYIDYNLSFTPFYPNFEYAMNTHLNSIKHQGTAKEDVEEARKQFKDFIETMAKDVIEKLPNKKIFGQDYESWYDYPYIKRGYNKRTSMSWTNYEPINIGVEWPGPRPEDYFRVTDQLDKNYDRVLSAQYQQDERMRDQFTTKYMFLKYNDFEITEFGWRTYLDAYSYSKY